MSKRLTLVAVSGALQQPSRTEALLEAILAELSGAIPLDARFVRLSSLAPKLATSTSRATLHPDVSDAIRTIEQADALVVGTPVFRGSYTGLFKHLFDFVGQESLFDVPVLLAATGGSDRHALVIDHQLRPLFSFFQAHTLPVGVYAPEASFTDYRVTAPAIIERIKLAVVRAVPLLLTAANRERDPAKASPGDQRLALDAALLK